MRLAIIVPDGMADRPEDFDGGLTPLARAATPGMDRLAARGEVGTALLVPEDVPVGSDVANLALLGLDPRAHRIGRAAVEAAGRGIELAPDEVAFRMNFVTIRDGVMEDYSAGGIPTSEAAELVPEVALATGAGTKVTAGVGYRHLMIVEDPGHELDNLKCSPPHDIQGKPVAEYGPRGEGARRIEEIARRANEALAGRHDRANAIWLWGQGRAAKLPGLRERFGVSGVAIAAVDLVKGVARLLGMDVIEVQGATGDLDTNYAGKGRAAAKALDEYEAVFVHVEAPDEAGHRGDVEAKRGAIESVDREVLAPVLGAVEDLAAGGEDARVLVLPDHLTPCSIKTHAHGAVPFVLFGSGVARNGAKAFTERAAGETGLTVERGWELIARALRPAGAGPPLGGAP